jgi:molybdopterin-guanine dinucleotide biosynthesis protein A
MAVRLARAFESLGLQAVLAVRDESLADLGLPLLVESEELPRHPLAGVVTALRQWPDIVVCPCDLPSMPAAGLARILASPAPAAAWDGKRLHPLVARMDRRSLPRAASLLQSQGSVTALMVGAARVSLPPPWLENLNHRPSAG